MEEKNTSKKEETAAEFNASLSKIITNTHPDNRKAISEALQEFADLQPYIDAELSKSKYGKMTTDEFLSLPDEEMSALWLKLWEKARKAQEVGDLPVIERRKISKAYMVNDKITNSFAGLEDIFKHIEPDGQIAMKFNDTPLPEDTKVPVIVRDEKEVRKEDGTNLVKPAVYTMVSLSYKGELKGKAARITPYDQSIFNTVCSIYATGHRTMTLNDIWRNNTQAKRKTAPNDKQLSRIKQTLEKYKDTDIYLNLENEIKNKLISPDGEKITPIVEDQLLHYRGYDCRTESGKSIAYGIEILSDPIQLSYAQAKHQILNIPAHWLELDKVSATEEVIAIRDYLIKAIHQYINGYRNNKVINYDALLKHVGVDMKEIPRQEKGRYTKKICKLLDGFVKKNIIGGYVVRNGEKNEVLGFELRTVEETAAEKTNNRKK